MHTKHFILATIVVVALACSSEMASAADVIKLNGATTVIDRVINKHKAAVEKTTGYTLEILGNATGKGLVDLVEGRCDASLSSEPIDIAIAAAKTAGKTVDAGTLQFHIVMNDEIVFVVHPSNPVTSLSWDQIKDIHTGKITSWKSVGGKDAAITVFTDTLTGGTRAMIKKAVLGGAEYSPSSKPLTSVKKVGEMVAISESGFGGLGKGFVEEGKVKLIQTNKLERPLGFITIGAPSEKVRKVIEAFKREARQ